jgi:RNase P subunit RPR2
MLLVTMIAAPAWKVRVVCGRCRRKLGEWPQVRLRPGRDGISRTRWDCDRCGAVYEVASPMKVMAAVRRAYGPDGVRRVITLPL